MKTSELTGALLDYWVARAEGRNPEPVRVGDRIVYALDHGKGFEVPRYSTDWAQGGPMIEKYELTLMRWKFEPEHRGADERDFWAVEGKCVSHYLDVYREDYVEKPWEDYKPDRGDTPLQAICRAVVRAAFGDEVGEVGDA